MNQVVSAAIVTVLIGAALYLFGIAYFEYMIVRDGSLVLYMDKWSWADGIITVTLAMVLAVIALTRIRKMFSKEHQTDSNMALEREKDAFTRLKTSLLSDPNHINKFVAIVGGKMVDSDVNKSALVERVYATHGYVPVYIDQVTAKEKKYRRLPSPRRA